MAKKARKPISEERRAALAAQLERGRATRSAKLAARSASSDDESLPIGESVSPVEPITEPAPSVIEAAARRQRLLGDLDPETAALFTDDELENIEREERAKASEEQKKQAMADVRAVARQRARIEHDLISPSVLRSEADQKRLAEPVTFRVTLPGDGAGHHGRNGLLVDGFLYQAGQPYVRPRAIFESLQANTYFAWRNEVQFKTLDQHKPGGSAIEVLSRTMPQFEIAHAQV